MAFAVVVQAHLNKLNINLDESLQTPNEDKFAATAKPFKEAYRAAEAKARQITKRQCSKSAPIPGPVVITEYPPNADETAKKIIDEKNEARTKAFTDGMTLATECLQPGWTPLFIVEIVAASCTLIGILAYCCYSRHQALKKAAEADEANGAGYKEGGQTDLYFESCTHEDQLI